MVKLQSMPWIPVYRPFQSGIPMESQISSLNQAVYMSLRLFSLIVAYPQWPQIQIGIVY